MTKLLDEEIEEDELFWNQDALKEVPLLQRYYFVQSYLLCILYFLLCNANIVVNLGSKLGS